MKFWSSKNKQVYVVTRKTRKPELVHSSKPWAPELEKLSNFYSAGRWDSFYSITSTWTAPSVIIHHLSFLALTSQSHSFALDSYLFFFFFKTLLIWLLGHLPLCSQVASQLSLAVSSLQRCLSWGCKIFPSLSTGSYFLPSNSQKKGISCDAGPLPPPPLHPILPLDSSLPLHFSFSEKCLGSHTLASNNFPCKPNQTKVTSKWKDIIQNSKHKDRCL